MKSSSLLAAVMLVASAWFTSLSAQDALSAASTNAPAPASTPALAAPATPAEQAVSTQPAASSTKPSYKAMSPDRKIPGDLKGVIEKIDAKAGTVVVDGKTVKLGPTGKVYVNNERKSMEDLKEGDRVAVTFRDGTDGTLIASLIIKGTRRHHKAKKADASETEPSKTE